MIDPKESALLSEMLEAIEVDLQAALQLLDPTFDQELIAMIRYHLGWSDSSHSRGKRIRPLLTLLSCAAAGGVWRNALPAASAIEWIHSFSLVHDDIEDQSTTRRGRPTLWTHWNTAKAINAGDSMFALARLTTNRLTEHRHSSETTVSAHQILDQACLRLTQGQQLDLAFETMETITMDMYLHMIEGKTSSLIAASTSLGALLADVSPELYQAYQSFGYHLGLAFQIQDDILGIWGDPTRSGKPSGEDLTHRKKTFPVVIGLTMSPDFRIRFDQDPSLKNTEELFQLLDDVDARHQAEVEVEKHSQQAILILREAIQGQLEGEELTKMAHWLIQREY
jgi:geranylgeranyl diphosphate synthase type I